LITPLVFVPLDDSGYLVGAEVNGRSNLCIIDMNGLGGRMRDGNVDLHPRQIMSSALGDFRDFDFDTATFAKKLLDDTTDFFRGIRSVRACEVDRMCADVQLHGRPSPGCGYGVTLGKWSTPDSQEYKISFMDFNE